MTETPKTMAQLGIKVAPAIEEWLQRLLAKSPADRLASMNDVGAAIEALRTGAPLAPAVPRTPGSATGTAVLPVQGEPSRGGPTPSVIPTAVLPAMPRATATTTLSENAAERLGRTEHRRRAPRWPLIAGAAVVLVLGAVSAALLRSRPAAPPNATPTETAAERTPTTAKTGPTAPGTPATTGAPPPTTPTPTTVTVEVDDAPAGLTVTLDGAAADLPARLPAGDQVHELVFRAPGHRARTLHLDGSQSRHVTLALEPNPATLTPPETAKAAAPPRDHTSDRHKRAPTAPRPADLTEDARKL